MFSTGLRSLAAILALIAASGLAAQEIRFFRIGSGATSGSYYPVAGLLAHAISAPPGTPTCDAGRPCGVPGLVASAVASAGSVANVEAIQSGALESGFVQGDIAAMAYRGKGPWQGQPADKLRAIANLYPESIHLVASGDSGIDTLADLRGKRVSLDETGSGTLLDAQIILSAAGLDDTDITASHLALDEAITAMRQGKIDAFFFAGGHPTGAIAELASQIPVRIVPIEARIARKIADAHPFLSPGKIPAGTYAGQTAVVDTLSVGAQWLTSADQPETLVHDLTRALWNAPTRELLIAGHPLGVEIDKDRALDGLVVPLHPGALRFYRESGLIE